MGTLGTLKGHMKSHLALAKKQPQLQLSKHVDEPHNESPHNTLQRTPKYGALINRIRNLGIPFA